MEKRIGLDAKEILRGLHVAPDEPERPDSESVEYRARVEALREAWLSGPEQRKWLLDVGVGLRLRHIPIDEALVPAQCAKWIASYRRGAGMILAGPVGSGKTVAAIHCLRQVYADSERHNVEFQTWEWQPPTTVYTKARLLYRAVFDRDTVAIERAREADVLVIDEWGGAYESPWPVAEMDGLIDDRWEERRATIITTNVHPTEGTSSFRAMAPRAFDRLCDEPGPGVVMMDRKSLRRIVQDVGAGMGIG